MLKNLIANCCDLVYPPNCLICRRIRLNSFPHTPYCASCLLLLESNVPPFCALCSRSLRAFPHRIRCRQCSTKQLHFDFAWSSLLYNQSLKGLIHQFKYGQKTLLRHSFAAAMISFVDQYALDIRQFDALVPVPLFPTRLRERGFNQSFLLAEIIAAHFAIPLETNLCTRSRPTQPQSDLSEKERWTNIQGAFKIKNLEYIHGRSFLIIDDLLTTGATVSELARILKTAGAVKVAALTLATTEEAT